MRTTRPFLAGALLLSTLACGGGGGDGPPTQPPVTAASVAVTVSSADPIVSLGETRTFSAVVRDANQGVIANAPVTWTTSSAGVASLSGTSGASITVTAAGNGGATITATSGSASGNATLTIAQRFSALSVTPATATVTVGGTQQLAVTAQDGRSNAIAGVTGATFASSDQARVTVNAAGLATGVAEGAATITASLTRDGLTRTATSVVTVGTFPLAASVEASATADLFAPASIEIARTGTVTWTFGARLHNVTFGGTAGAPANIPNTTGAQVARTFNTAGTFAYNCTLHAGMSGTVSVR